MVYQFFNSIKSYVLMYVVIIIRQKTYKYRPGLCFTCIQNTLTLFFLDTDNIYNTPVHFTISTIVSFYITIDEIMIIILKKINLNETPLWTIGIVF